jgi:4-diphosphocytidyl-2C-methyl-D-erythritol kinase
MRIRAYAKINLGLRVLGGREDGYHEIRTLMQSISLADELELEPRPSGVTLEVEPDLGIPPEENLVYRAARLILARAGCSEGVHIRLLKRIPAGAGLGGASSDAAATLAGINELFQLGFRKEELKALGLELGSDAPFFFEGGLCRAEGRGERLSRLPSPFSDHFIVLLKPPCALRTAEVYAEFDRTGGEPAEGQKLRMHSSHDLIRTEMRPPRGWKRLLRRANVEPGEAEAKGEELEYELDLANDLEGAAWKLCPELERYRAFLERWRERVGLFFGMSGSGPTYYAFSWAWRPGLMAGRRDKHISKRFLTRPRSELERFMGEARDLGAWVSLCLPTQVGYEFEPRGRP